MEDATTGVWRYGALTWGVCCPLAVLIKQKGTDHTRAWTIGDIPDQTGRIAVITGASSGIAAEAAAALAAKGAQAILAVPDPARGEATPAAILARHPAATLTIARLDLANLASIRADAERLRAELPLIDLLLNNARRGLQPIRGTTDGGFERMFGTNHLGHFAFSAQLVATLLPAPTPRVVTIASIAHRRGRIDFDDLQTERPYNPGKAYSQSNLANLLFALNPTAAAAPPKCA